MATYNFEGYSPSSIQFLGGPASFANDASAVGQQFRINPGFDAATDRYQYEITETGGGNQFSGDQTQNEVGDDSDQFGTVRDAAGTVVGGGPTELIYLERGYSVEAPDGTIINFYTVEVAGVDMGIVADAPLQPGVTYEVISQTEIGSGGPLYSTFGMVDYDPATANAIEGGSRDDVLQGGGANDTIEGGGGSDSIDGGSGADVIDGDAPSSGRVGFKWSDVPDPHDGGQIDDEDTTTTGSQSVGGVDVSFTFSGTGQNDGFETAANYVTGIDAGAGSVDPNSSWQIGAAHNETAQMQLAFSQEVENVSFRINDLDFNADQQEQVTVQAFDLAGNTLPVTITFGANLIASDTDAMPGADTGTGTTAQSSSDASASMLIDIAGPVGEIVITYVDLDTSGGGGLVNITDVYFDEPGPVGNDTIDGGAGNDLITTGAGNDTVVMSDGGGNDTVTDFDMGDDNGDGFTNDQIDVSGLTDASGQPVKVWDVTVTDDGVGNALLTFPNGESLLLQGVTSAQASSAQSMHSMGIPCFTTGTLIKTPTGEVPVETLRVGDIVVTRDNGPKTIRWIGARQLGLKELRSNPKLCPVLVQAGALGNSRDLLVSPQHGILITDHTRGGGERLVRAAHLARLPKRRIRVAMGKRRVTYIHMLFDQHEIVFSNGLASESFYPGKWGLGALAIAPKREVLDLFPELERADAEQVYGATARSFFRFGDLKKTMQDREAGCLLSP
ncbi:MAG: Hint domain-containing protein [Pseudomonadota bacterium]